MTTTTRPLVLLTGVTGFLGGAVLYELLGGEENDHEAVEGEVRVVGAYKLNEKVVFYLTRYSHRRVTSIGI